MRILLLSTVLFACETPPTPLAQPKPAIPLPASAPASTPASAPACKTAERLEEAEVMLCVVDGGNLRSKKVHLTWTFITADCKDSVQISVGDAKVTREAVTRVGTMAIGNAVAIEVAAEKNELLCLEGADLITVFAWEPSKCTWHFTKRKKLNAPDLEQTCEEEEEEDGTGKSAILRFDGEKYRR